VLRDGQAPPPRDRNAGAGDIMLAMPKDFSEFFMKRAAIVGIVSLLAVEGFLQSQTRPSKYKIASCLDLGELAARQVDPKTRPADFKTDCNIILNAGGQPVLYMGRDYAGNHLLLVKTP